MRKRWGFSLILLLCLVGCTPTKPVNSPYQSIQDSLQHGSAVDRSIAAHHMDLPANVESDLVNGGHNHPYSHHASSPADKRFNLAVKDVTARTFFLGLVKGTPYSVIVSPKVSGSITLDLKSVTLNDILNVVQETYGYQYKRTATGIEVFPGGLQTHVFNVNYLNLSREGETQTSVNSSQPSTVGNNTTMSQNFAASGGNNGQNPNAQTSSEIKTTSQSHFWEVLSATLKAIVGNTDGRQVITDPGAGVVVVKAFPAEMREVTDYLDTIQQNVDRQVIIEAKICEVILNDSYKSGINWKLLGFQQGNETAQDSFTDNVLTLTASLRNRFSTVVKMLSTQGNVQVLSSPRIATLNNQKAVIKVGKDEYFVTGLTDSTLASGGGTDNSQNVNLTPFFSGIALDVTPEIDQDKNVTLHIHPSISEVSQVNKEVDTGQNNKIILPTASSQIREADSIVRAHNGQVVIIGGLMENLTSESLQGTPYASKLPFLGAAFRNQEQSAKKAELVILLRPIVVDHSTWYKRLDRIAGTFKKLKRGYHYGDKPEIYGDAAEYPNKVWLR